MRSAFLMILAMTWTAVAAAAPARPMALDGDWQVGIDVPDWQLHDVRTRLSFAERDGGRFEASSRPGALRDVYGVWRALLARLLMPDLRGGAWLRLIDGRRGAGGAIEATLASAFVPRLTMRCAPVEPLDCALRRGDAPFGRLRATRAAAGGADASGYAALSDAIAATLRAHHYDPRRLDADDWQRPLARLQRAVAQAQDDLDVLAAWRRWSGALPDSHVTLLRGGDVPAAPDAGAETPVRVTWDGDVAELRIAHFRLAPDAAAAQLRDAFVQIDARPARALIVDLRGNPGGNLSAMRVAGHLLDEAVPAGHFVTRRWWRQHAAAPAPDQLPRFDGIDPDALRDALRHGPGVHAVVDPQSPVYRGPVYVLIDGGSASAAEPLVHLLQQRGRATVVGERSAGRMLSSEAIAFAPGWTLRVPVADYYAADGTRLEGRGVTPDVRAKSAQALRKAIGLARGETE